MTLEWTMKHPALMKKLSNKDFLMLLYMPKFLKEVQRENSEQLWQVMKGHFIWNGRFGPLSKKHSAERLRWILFLLWALRSKLLIWNTVGSTCLIKKLWASDMIGTYLVTTGFQSNKSSIIGLSYAMEV